MNEILSKKHYRRSFFTIFSILVVLLIVIRYIVIPIYDPSLHASLVSVMGNIVDKILVSLIITVAIGTFVFWLTPENVTTSHMEVIEPRAISDLLEQSMPKTEVWWYKGGCGRYFRARTLPMIANAARAASFTREINVIILDPSNEKLCEAYATYRSSLRSAKEGHPWTAERVKNELFATILSIIIKRYQEPLLRINLGLTSHFSSFRFDMSSEYVIITKEDRFAPAMRCDKDTFFYQSYRDEMVLAQRQSRKIKELTEISIPVDGTSIKMMLEDVGFDVANLDDETISNILKLVQTSENPYA